MRPLLIHNDNSYLMRVFHEKSWFIEKFNLSEKYDVDLQLTSFINDRISNKEITAIFIKVTLSENYLEFLGLRLGLHIRLSLNLPNINKLPIIFLCEESINDLCRSYVYPEILFSKGVYLTTEADSNIQSYFRLITDSNLIGCDSIDALVNRLNILPPSNYQSHHSIANEWVLNRFFSMFEIDNKNKYYLGLKEKLNDLEYFKSLHFKYLEAKSKRQKFKRNHTINPFIEGITNKKIAVIDDEINKGWLEFHKYVFSNSSSEIIPFVDFKKDEKKIDLINNLKNWILSIFSCEDPVDIFIVDLRLHDDDFIEKDFENLTGIQIIKFLKDKNPGIQVIIWTASNKVWNFQECLKLGVKFFSVKESPQTYSTRNETIASFNHYCNQLTYAANHTFLADIFRKIDTIKKGNSFSRSSSHKEKRFFNLTFRKNGLLDQIFNLLNLNSFDEAIINQCLLISFQILENFCDLDIVGSFGKLNRDKWGSGSVWLKNDGGQKHIFINESDQNFFSCFEFVKGRFVFQSSDSKETPTTFNVFPDLRQFSNSNGLDTSFLVKLISVLHFRENLPKEDIDRIISLRYYRSNVAAHLTGNVVDSHKISPSEISFFIEIFKKLFI